MVSQLMSDVALVGCWLVQGVVNQSESVQRLGEPDRQGG